MLILVLSVLMDLPHNVQFVLIIKSFLQILVTITSIAIPLAIVFPAPEDITSAAISVLSAQQLPQTVLPVITVLIVPFVPNVPLSFT